MKRHYFYLISFIIVLTAGAFFLVHKKSVPNILIFSVENLYFENGINNDFKSDIIYSSLSEFAIQNHLKLISVKDNKSPIQWMDKIGLWPESTWGSSKLRQVGLGTDMVNYKKDKTLNNYNFYIEILNETMAVSYITNVINRKIGEKSTNPFFLLINFNYLIPPLYDVGLTSFYQTNLSGKARQLLDAYTFTPENFKNKSFVFSILFDDYRFSHLTSLQSAAIALEIKSRDIPFWSESYSEFKNDKDNSSDLNLIQELYLIKKKETARTILEILGELKKNSSLDNTVIVFSNSQHINVPKNEIHKKFFTEDIQQVGQFLVLGNEANTAQLNISNISEFKLDEKLLKFIQDY